MKPPPLISRFCPECKAYQNITFQHEKGESTCHLMCPQCGNEWGTVEGEFNEKDFFEHCPVCPCSQFYIDKDFNKPLGCLFIAIAIVLVPKTFGLSLPVAALIDFLLHKRSKTFVICYRCATEFRGFNVPKQFKTFIHVIGLKYDKYR